MNSSRLITACALVQLAFADRDMWDKYVQAYQYEATYTEVTTVDSNILGCIRIKPNWKDFKAAIGA